MSASSKKDKPRNETLAAKVVPAWLPGAAAINEALYWPEELPRPKVSLRSALLVGADEALTVGLGLASRMRFATPSFRQRSTQEMEDALEYFQDSGWIENPQGYHLKPPALEKVIFKKSSSHGTDFEHMTFEGGYVPRMGEAGRARWLGYENNQTSHCWVLRHKGPQRPWMIHIHGYRMGTPFLDFSALIRHIFMKRRASMCCIMCSPCMGPEKRAQPVAMDC